MKKTIFDKKNDHFVRVTFQFLARVLRTFRHLWLRLLKWLQASLRGCEALSFHTWSQSLPIQLEIREERTASDFLIKSDTLRSIRALFDKRNFRNLKLKFAYFPIYSTPYETVVNSTDGA